MPGPDTSAADAELDALFADDAADKLPVVKAPVPHVNKVLDLQSSPEADAELEKLMAEPEGPHHATKEEADSAEMPTSGKTIDMPVQQIEGDPGTEDKRSITDKAVDALAHLTRPSSRDGIETHYSDEVTPEQRAAVEQQAHDKLGVKDPNQFIERMSDAAVGAATPGVVKGGTAAVSAGLPAALAGKTALQRLASNFGQNFVQTGAREFIRDPEHDIGNAGKAALASGIGAAGLGMAGEGLGRAAVGARKAADELMTHTFMSAPQRSALRARKGPDALSQLGADAEKAGLFKARNLWDRMPFVPVSANRVADNAARVQAEAGKTIGDFENSLAAQGVNPDVNVAPIADELRGQGATASAIRDPAAAAHASDMNTAADALDPRAPIPGPPSPGTMPLQDAIATKRFQGDQINWARNPNTTPMRRGEDVARKFTWGQLKDTIQRSLDEQAAKGAIDPKALENYRAANKNFTTASTAYDPALRMAERQNQRGLSLKDLMAGAVMGGPTGAVTALGSGAAHGKLPSTLARGAKISGGISRLGQGAAIAEQHMLRDDTSHPSSANPVQEAKAQLPPGTPDHEVKAAANLNVKESLKSLFDRFLQKKE